MNVGFQCPVNGVPVVAEWDGCTGVLTFTIEDEDYNAKHCTQEGIEEAHKWCETHGNKQFDDIEEVNNYLRFIGVEETLVVW